MRLSQMRIVMALALLFISGVATAGLIDIDYCGSEPPDSGLENIKFAAMGDADPTPPMPEMASNPSPSNGTLNVSVDADLAWTPGLCSADPSSYQQHIYMATNPDDLWSAFLATTDADSLALNTLQNNTTYYWRIDTFCTDMGFIGETWQFTTQVPEPATILLLAIPALALFKKRRTA